MAHLLLIDDDPFILQSLRRLLVTEGYDCATASGGGEAWRVLSNTAFDLILLDVGLPDTDGFTLCRRIRAEHQMPILLLTARGASTDKVAGLEVGADDYLIKPVDPRELIARVRAHLRRAGEYNQPRQKTTQIRVGRILIDPTRCEVFRDDRRIDLTRKEFDLLHFLAQHPNRILSAEWIYERVWGCDPILGLRTLPVYIRRLRCKIEPDPDHPSLLLNVRGFGYKLTTGER